MIKIIGDKIFYKDLQVAKLTPETCPPSHLGEFIDEFEEEIEAREELEDLKESIEDLKNFINDNF